MKIPFGYGALRISFPASHLPDGVGYQWMLFKVDQNSFREEIEVYDEFVNLTGNIKKKIIGYHLRFDLILIDDSLESASTQQNIIDFQYYYNINTKDDKAFYIWPIYLTGMTNIPGNNVKYFKVILENRHFANLSNTRERGQYLHLQMKTVNMISREDYDYIIWRETADGTWDYMKFSDIYGYRNIMTGMTT